MAEAEAGAEGARAGRRPGQRRLDRREHARTFVSLPAGHARVPFGRFVALTSAGCAIWSAAYILAGDLAGAGWQQLATIVGRGSLVATALAVAALVELTRRSSAHR